MILPDSTLPHHNTQYYISIGSASVVILISLRLIPFHGWLNHARVVGDLDSCPGALCSGARGPNTAWGIEMAGGQSEAYAHMYIYMDTYTYILKMRLMG